MNSTGEKLILFFIILISHSRLSILITAPEEKELLANIMYGIVVFLGILFVTYEGAKEN